MHQQEVASKSGLTTRSAIRSLETARRELLAQRHSFGRTGRTKRMKPTALPHK